MTATFDQLYSALGDLVTEATGRKWWRKTGIQGVPKEAYATIYLSEASGLQHDVVEVEDVEAGGFNEIPWNAARLDVKIELYKDSALTDAHKIRAALRLTKRFFDIWTLCGLVSAIDVADVSGAFRMDIENRADVRFMIAANLPVLADAITDIETVDVNVTHVHLDGEETETTVTIENTEN